MVEAGAADREPLKPSDWASLADEKLLECACAISA